MTRATFIIVAAAMCATACGPQRPNRGSVTPLLQAFISQQTQDFVLGGTEGCVMAFGEGNPIDPTAEDEFTTKATKLTREKREHLRKEREMGLITFTYSIERPESLEAIAWRLCQESVMEMDPRLLFPRPIRPVVLKKWGTALTPEAEKSGLALNASFPIARRRLVGIIGLIDQDSTTTLADYEWEWELTPAGRAFHFEATAEGTGRITLRKYDDGWRIAEAFRAGPFLKRSASD